MTEDDKIIAQGFKDAKKAIVLLAEAYQIFWKIRASMSGTIYGDKIHGLTNEMDKFFKELNAQKEKVMSREKILNEKL